MSLDPSSGTFREAHQALLRELDEAWSCLRVTYARLDFVDAKGQDYQDVKNRFKETQEALWRLKESWGDVK